MKEWTACWGCYQPPHIYGEWDVSTGAQGCEFRDIVLPTAFAVFRMTESQRWGMSLANFSEQVGGFEDERSWFSWLREEVSIFGERAVRAVMICDRVLERLEEGEE